VPSILAPAPVWAAALLLPVGLVLSSTLIVAAMRGGAATADTCGARGTTMSMSFQGGHDAPGEGVPPSNFIPAYFAAADQPDAKLGFELGPYVLMAIHEIESGFGRSNAPGVKSGINHVGDVSCCKGPFQFYDLPKSSTWRSKSPVSGRSYGRDGDGDGDVDIYSNFDGMFAAAAYLHAAGAPGDWRKAIYAYNHAGWYVDKVLRRARAFQAEIPRPSQEPEPREPTSIQVASATAPRPTAIEVGATRYGDAGDASAGRRGYRGDPLEGSAAFAELGYAAGANEASARTGLLGNLPHRAALRISYKGSTVDAVKLDVGEGGPPIKDKPRAIALWWQLADELGLREDDVVRVERVDGGAVPEESPGGSENAPAGPACAAPEGVEQVVNASDGGPYQEPLTAGSFTVSAPFWQQREGYRHEGTDLAAPTGTPISAVGAGKVVLAAWVGGYGKYTCIQHAQTLTSCYAHQASIRVAVGDTVQRGQQIGEVGNTGHSTGPHLHFEMRVGSNSEAPPTCPANYVGAPRAEWCRPDSPGFNNHVSQLSNRDA
jgi:murein DD-endopeptidase MepM/ murein hydrolase activator NlpD